MSYVSLVDFFIPHTDLTHFIPSCRRIKGILACGGNNENEITHQVEFHLGSALFAKIKTIV